MKPGLLEQTLAIVVLEGYGLDPMSARDAARDVVVTIRKAMEEPSEEMLQAACLAFGGHRGKWKAMLAASPLREE